MHFTVFTEKIILINFIDMIKIETGEGETKIEDDTHDPYRYNHLHQYHRNNPDDHRTSATGQCIRHWNICTGLICIKLLHQINFLIFF